MREAKSVFPLTSVYYKSESLNSTLLVVCFEKDVVSHPSPDMGIVIHFMGFLECISLLQSYKGKSFPFDTSLCPLVKLIVVS